MNERREGEAARTDKRIYRVEKEMSRRDKKSRSQQIKKIRITI